MFRQGPDFNASRITTKDYICPDCGHFPAEEYDNNGPEFICHKCHTQWREGIVL